MFNSDFSGSFSDKTLEFFAPFDQQDAACIHQIIKRQSIKLPLGIDTVQVNVEENNIGAPEFVDESKSGAGYVIGPGCLKGFGNAFDQRGLTRSQFTSQQDDRARLQLPGQLTAQLGG